jgi:hypothetical protein
MPTNKFEHKALNQINLHEGLISAIAKFFLGSNFRKSMKELERMKKDDPEFAAGMASLAQNYKTVENMLDRLCKKHPDHPNCK